MSDIGGNPELDALTFTNRFTAELPVDPELADPETGIRPRQVFKACSSRVIPNRVSAPEVVSFSAEVASELGLSADTVKSAEFAQVFAGNTLLDGMDPFSMCYGGHQFGNWAGQLGDGRAIALGEVLTEKGEHLTLQLKGAGLTPYSRGADGRAVLRSSVREFLCSEAMHHLGVPTTRALSLISTGDKVVRDMLYDGNAAPEPGAIVCRVSPTFTRFGNFQIFTSREDLDTLRQLAESTIRNDFPHLAPADGSTPGPDTYAAMFREICQRTAEVVVHWMRVGFVHGVLNTDNMGITGLTIDYGPYGWLEDFDPEWTPNTTDRAHRRYRFGNQPAIGQWNLLQLANALFPLVEDAAPLEAALHEYADIWDTAGTQMQCDKLGIGEARPHADTELVDDLHTLLRAVETDMTIFYRQLAQVRVDEAADLDDAELAQPLEVSYYGPEQLTDEVRQLTAAWLRRYVERVQSEGVSDEVRRRNMNRVNPKYVLRNYMAQVAIDAAEDGDYSVVNELLELLRDPYGEQPEHAKWYAKRPDWARTRVGCSMLSCSS